MVAVGEACRATGSHGLSGAVLFSSLEVCVLCFAAAQWAGVGTLVYALPKAPWMVERGHDLRELNTRSTRPIELIHVAAAEQRALSVVTEWVRRRWARTGLPWLDERSRGVRATQPGAGPIVPRPQPVDARA